MAYLLIAASIPLLGVALASASTGDWDWVLRGAYAVIGTSAMASLLLIWENNGARAGAAFQCLEVAEKYSIRLSVLETVEVVYNPFAGWVFNDFFILLREKRPDLIPENAFVGSGGETVEAYRNIVRYLWEKNLALQRD